MPTKIRTFWLWRCFWRHQHASMDRKRIRRSRRAVQTSVPLPPSLQQTFTLTGRFPHSNGGTHYRFKGEDGRQVVVYEPHLGFLNIHNGSMTIFRAEWPNNFKGIEMFSNTLPQIVHTSTRYNEDGTRTITATTAGGTAIITDDYSGELVIEYNGQRWPTRVEPAGLYGGV